MPARLGNFTALGRPQKNHLTFDTAKVLMISSSSKLLSSNFVLINVNRNKSGFNGYTKVSKCRNVDFVFLQNARFLPRIGQNTTMRIERTQPRMAYSRNTLVAHWRNCVARI